MREKAAIVVNFILGLGRRERKHAVYLLKVKMDDEDKNVNTNDKESEDEQDPSARASRQALGRCPLHHQETVPYVQLAILFCNISQR